MRAARPFNQLVEHAGLMCVVFGRNQRAWSRRFDVDAELIKQYLQRLHQLQHFVLPRRLTAAFQLLAAPVAPRLRLISPAFPAVG